MKKNRAISRSVAYSGGHRYARGSAAFFLTLSLILLVLYRAGNPVALRLGSQITDTAVPVLTALGQPFAAAEAAGIWVGEMVALREENIRLKNQNIQLLQWHAAARELEVENQALRTLLNTAPAPARQFVTAKVVSDAGGPYMRATLINAGTVAGVKSDHAVVANEGLFGRVVEAGDRSARVLLLSDINSRVPVMLETSREKSILSGTGTALPVLSYLAAGHEPQPGERVVTSGDGGLFPAGIPVGQVVESSNGVWSVQPFVRPEKTSFVRTVDLSF